MFMSGVQVTLIYAIIGTVAGFIIGLILGGIRALEINDSDSAAVKVLKRIGRLFTSLYIWVFRGTPMMVQAMFLYYGLQPIIGWDGPTAGLFVISINTGAYMAEIIRSGLQSVDSGQSEAAKSLGMANRHMMMKIILPQAVKNILPALGNEFIVLLKETSVAGYIGVADLTKGGDIITSNTYNAFLPLIAVALIYLVMVLGLQALVGKLERRLRKSDH